MPTLDDLRTAQESQLEELLARLDRRHRAMLRAAIERYGRVQDIPQEVWDRIRADMESEEVAALILLAIAAADEWTTGEISRQGVRTRGYGQAGFAGYAMDAARRTQAMAAQTTDTLRDRLARKVEDMRTAGPGRVGDLTDEGIERALDDVLTTERRRTIAIDQTTSGFSVGQRGARERIAGGDGATLDTGQRVAIELIWRTELDDRVCPRCSPLEGQPEEVWSRVFPDGPGPEAHPNCRCSLQPQVPFG